MTGGRMKPELPYYDIKELRKRWSENGLTEQDLLKYGESGELQFSIRLGPSTEQAHIEISQYYKEKAVVQLSETDKDIFKDFGKAPPDEQTITRKKLCDKKTVSFKSRELFDVTPLMVSDLFHLSDKTDIILRILPWCTGCERHPSTCDDRFTETRYVLNPIHDHADQASRRHPEDFTLRYTKKDLVVRPEEVLRFEESFDSINISSNGQRGEELTTGNSIDKGAEAGDTLHNKVENQKESFEELIENLTIRYEDNSTISYQKPGEAPKKVLGDDLFAISEKGKNITWNEFLEILQDSPGHNYIIKSDTDRKRMEEVSRKLLNYFQEKFGLSSPKKYKLHERDKTRESGTYRFKFKIEYEDNDNEDSASMETFRKKFFYTIKNWERTHDDDLFKIIQKKAGIGLNKKFLTNKEISEALKNLEIQKIDHLKISKENLFDAGSTPDDN